MEHARHGGHRPGRHERQRRAGARRRTAVLPGLLRLRQARRGHRRHRGRRHRQGLRTLGLRADRRRDGRDAGHVSGRRIRSGRLCRGGGRKIGHPDRQGRRPGRCGARPGQQRRAFQRFQPGAQVHRARRRHRRRARRQPPARHAGRAGFPRRADGADPAVCQAGAGRHGGPPDQGAGAYHRRWPAREHPARAARGHGRASDTRAAGRARNCSPGCSRPRPSATTR